jgi:O-antigen/teichoic acid export membrane protein
VTITLHPYLMSVAGTGESERIREVIGTIVEHILLIGVLAVGLTYLFCRDAANVLLGHEFREGSIVMPIALAGMFFNNVGMFVHKPFEIIGRTRPMVVLGLVAVAANMGLNFVLVPRLGYVGAARDAAVVPALCGRVGARAGGSIWRIDLSRTAGFILVTVLGVGRSGPARDGTERVAYRWNLAVAVLASALLTAWCLLGVFRRTSVFRVWVRGGASAK